MGYSAIYINPMIQADRVDYDLIIIDEDGVTLAMRNSVSFNLDHTQEDMDIELTRYLDRLYEAQNHPLETPQVIEGDGLPKVDN